MAALPDLIRVDMRVPPEVAERVERERAAHDDSHIDAMVRQWWDRFPHVFSNPAAQRLDRLYEARMGDIEGKVVLEYRCGNGRFAAWLYDRGASVIGIDISDFKIAQANRKFSEMAADPDRFRFAVMDAHALQLPNESVDFVSGNGILHHLDLSLAMAEIDRVLKPGKKAIFFEPLGGNPILKVYRRVAQFQTDDEQPFEIRQLQFLRSKGAELHFSGSVTLPVAAVTSILLPRNPNNWLLRVASRAELHLNKMRAVQSWNRNTMIVYEKPPTDRNLC
jgi:ubiquinone/menaquinone biosynthesis C-methylase UbiE